MLSAARALWRQAREVPVLGAALRAGDRAWWARTIRRADVVDVEFVRAQLGRPVGVRGAVRRYVRGGFRSGMCLNPLLCERTVSRQLPEDDRVPALYAYLVNERGGLGVSPHWDAAAYDAAHPDAAADPAGAVGHAWRAALRGEPMLLGHGERARAIEGARLLDVARSAARSARAGAPATLHRGESAARGAHRDEPGGPGAFACLLDAREPEYDDAVRVAAHGVDRGLRTVVGITSTGAALPADPVVQASLLSLWCPEATVAILSPAGPADAADELLRDDGAVARQGVLVVRGPGEQLDPTALDRLLDEGATRWTAPLLLAPDGTVASAGVVVHGGRGIHLLAGHPSEDAARLGDAVDVPAPGTVTGAWPIGGRRGGVRVLTATTIVGDRPAAAAAPDLAGPDLDVLLAKAGFAIAGEGPSGPVLLRRAREAVLADGTRVPSLRWALKTAAPAGRAGLAWGDTHFAAGLARALRRAGQEVVVDSYEARDRPSGHLDDVVLVLRGPRRIDPPATGRAARLLWVISHPDEITRQELSRFDTVFAASVPWARRASERFAADIRPLLQCTDRELFRPQGIERGSGIVFVGTARGIARPSVVVPVNAGIPVEVYGPDWRGYIPAANIRAAGIANSALPALYEGAGVVLNDHWPAMQAEGFISNRPYDVVAAGGRVVSDDVEGLEEHFGGAVRTYGTTDELVEMLRGGLDELFPSEAELAAVAARIRAEDSFDARARSLLDAVLG